jgi:hypothetical protein
VIVSVLAGSLASVASADDFRYLAANSAQRVQLQNVNVKVGRATYVGKVLELDQSWETPYMLELVGSVVTDPDTGQLRMFCELMVPGQEYQRFVAMATSTNGINWTKPALGVTGKPYTDSPSNNFVNLPQTWMGSPCVFVDPNAPASNRYRMSATVNESSLYAMTSSNGVNWSSVATIDSMTGGTHGLDSLNVTLWDLLTQKYTEYGRYWYPGTGQISWGRRGVYRKQSSAWEGTSSNWTGSRQLILDPIDVIPSGNATNFDIYTPGIQTYHGQYIGLPAIYYHPGSWTASGPVYPTFMHSRDGTNWSFPNPYHSILDLSAHGQNETNFGQAYPATSVLERNGLCYIYYSYFPENHNSTSPTSGTIHLATIPEDRFVGIQASPGSTGTWTTAAITLPCNPGHLILNAVVGGSVRVEVLDAATGEPFAGFGETDGVSMSPGDHLSAPVQWNDGDTLNPLAGKSVAFRFVMDDATIYSFHFSATATKFSSAGFEEDTAGANPASPVIGSWNKPSQTTAGAIVVNDVPPGPFAGTNYLRIQRTSGSVNTAQLEAVFGTVALGNTLNARFAFRYESTGSSSASLRLMSGTIQRAAVIAEPDYSVPYFYTFNGANAGQVNSSLAVTPGTWQTIGIQYTSGSPDLTLTVNGIAETLSGAVTGGTVDRIRFNTASVGTTYYLDGVDSLTVSTESWPDKIKFTSSARDYDGSIKLSYRSVTGASGICYTLWASTNADVHSSHFAWTPLTNGVLLAATEFTDTQAVNFPCRFYMITTY